MVRPYLPRFLREGDRAAIKVVVNNASEDELRGTVDFDVIDPESEKSLLGEFGLGPADATGVAFTVAAGGGTNLTFPVRAPNRVGEVAFKVVARAGEWSDGELRPLPVLPGRVHLAQSRFATLRDADRRTLHFADLAADDDPTRIHEQLVVTLDAQLFYSVLNALPYLVNYPYQCTEQNLNRFLSTGILSNYPDPSWTGDVFTADERERMLAFSFRHWRRHSPLLKGYLALTLHRAERPDDARLVFDSVMDSAKTTQDEGTFWAPEDRAWLWYNDTIETHAFALRTLAELDPDDARRHGLVHWLFLNKKLNHWKSTRATAEVVYSLVHYLEQEGALGVREEATVRVGRRAQTWVFEPDRYTGRSTQLVIAGEEIDPASMATVEVEKETKGFVFASATWHFSTEEMPAEARGDFFAVTRRYFKRVQSGGEWVLRPLADGTALAPGDQVEVQLSLRTKHAAEYVHLRDPRGAGFEPETTTSRYQWDLGIGWYEEVRDSGTNFFFEWLPVGEYTFKYRLRANLGGIFRVGPATIQSMYAPEFTGYSSGARLEIAGGD